MHPFFAPRAAPASTKAAAPAPAPAPAPAQAPAPAPAPAPPAASPAKAAGTKRALAADDEEEEEVSLGALRAAKAAAGAAAAPPAAAAAAPSPAKAKGSGGGGGGASAAATAAAMREDKGKAAAAAAAEEEEDDEEEVLEEEEEEEGGAAGSVAGGSTKSGGGGAAKKKARKSSAASGGYGNDEFYGYMAYHPIRDAPWEPKLPGAPIPYAALVDMFARAEAKGSRLYKTGQLANLLRSAIALSPADVLPILYLTNGTLAPAFEGLELGVGDSILAKALSETTGKKLADIKDEVKAADGDFGPSAEAARSKQRTLTMAAPPAALTVRGVYAAFKSMANESGTKSVERRIATIKKLLVAAKGVEARYIMRGLQCKLRIGMTGKTVPVALAHAITLTAPLGAAEAAAAAAAAAGAGAGAASSSSSSSSSSSAAAAGGGGGGGGGGSSLVFHDAARGAGLPGVSLAPRGCGGGEGRKMSPSAWEALQGGLEESAEHLKAVWSQLPSFDAIVPHLLRVGIAGAAEACQLTPGIPVAPMLAKPTKGVAEILDRLEGKLFTCEYKYDGERAQVHALRDGSTRIFSRNSEEMSSKYPDLALALQAAMGRGGKDALGAGAGAGASAGAGSSSSEAAGGGGGGEGGGGGGGEMHEGGASSSSSSSAAAAAAAALPPVLDCVLDGESVAYDRESGRLLPFQVLSTRSRKDATLESIKVPVIYLAFDLLYLNGQSLLMKTLAERRALLRASFQAIPGKFAFAQSKEGTDTEEIGAFLTAAIKDGCEGLMIKTLTGPDSLYAPDKRSLNWLKLKKDYMDGLADSLDLVPVAAWRGKGKRAGVYGVYLLACYDPDTDEYQSVCKVGTGFSEENLEGLAQGLTARNCTRSEKPPNVAVGEALVREVDVWFSPEDSEVWEIKAADLSISPVHMAAVGKVNPEKGIGLRFPRFLHRRADKAPQDATTSDTVLDMYRAQSTVKGRGGAEEEEDD